MGIKTTLLNAVTSLIRKGVQVGAAGRSPQALAHISEKLAPVVEQDAGIGKLRFFCPSILPEWRARTLMTKEPETMEWINSFDKSDVLWDVGANVGVYTLYAALHGVSVYAFEPSPSNYYLLSRNIEINGFDEKISSFCVAFNDETQLESLYMASTELGGALSSFGEAKDWRGDTYDVKFKQAMLGYSIDDFISQFIPAFPNHLKIDVDGIEKKIVDGATKTLSDKRLKTVLIELNINLDECSEIINIMDGHGFVLDKREHAEEFYLGEALAIYNHIFVRK
jgi:FkbM family methyltransferase